MNFPYLCGAIERSKIVNAVLKYMGELNQRSAIDQSKLNGQRILWKTKVIEEEKLQNNETLSICFDERKDKTLILNEKKQRNSRNYKKHYVLVTYPEKKYFDHVSPQSGKSVDVAKEILEVAHEK